MIISKFVEDNVFTKVVLFWMCSSVIQVRNTHWHQWPPVMGTGQFPADAQTQRDL